MREIEYAANMVLPQWGVTCFYETFVHKQTTVLLLNICAKIPHCGNTQNVIGQHNKKGFIEINFVGIIDLKANFKYPYINNTIC